jgi:glycosyltransferase involved in cell wall biosynthesis
MQLKVLPAKAKTRSDLKLAVLTTMNTVCGVAEYSRDLYTPIIKNFSEFHYIANYDVADRTRPDTKNVLRLWEYGEITFAGVLEWLAEDKPHIFHIQLHSANHFPLKGLVNLLKGIENLAQQPKVIITPHTVISPAFDLAVVKNELKNVDKILVHKQKDFEYLKSIGLKNIVLFPLPYDVYPQRNKMAVRKQLGLGDYEPVIATHGLVSEHKGLLQVLEAVAELKQTYPDIMWVAANALNINNSTSSGTFATLEQRCKELGLEENIRFISDFISADEVIALIQTADVGICAYEERGESASAVIRKFLASGVPTIVTDIPMMQELNQEVYKIADNSPADIVRGIREILNNQELAQNTVKAALAKANSTSWKVMGQKLLELYSEI